MGIASLSLVPIAESNASSIATACGDGLSIPSRQSATDDNAWFNYLMLKNKPLDLAHPAHPTHPTIR